MIFLVPMSPEVPPPHQPRLWQAPVLVLCLGVIYLVSQPVFDSDEAYVRSLETLLNDGNGGPIANPAQVINRHLAARPLLRIAPSKGSWSIWRLFAGNFLHDGPAHLLLNLIGVFAGVRI